MLLSIVALVKQMNVDGVYRVIKRRVYEQLLFYHLSSLDLSRMKVMDLLKVVFQLSFRLL